MWDVPSEDFVTFLYFRMTTYIHLYIIIYILYIYTWNLPYQSFYLLSTFLCYLHHVTVGPSPQRGVAHIRQDR